MTTTTDARPARIRAIRVVLAEMEADRRRLEHELTELLVALERRPPDGSDQPALFKTEEQPQLF